MSARPKGIWLLTALFVLPILNSAAGGGAGREADGALTERDVLGWWIVEQPEGGTLYLLVKQQGRSSSFFSGTSSNHIDKGRWETAGNQLIIRWANGYTDVLEHRGRRFLKYEYAPGTSTDGDAIGVLPVRKLNSELIGSLVVTDPIDESAPPAPPLLKGSLPPNRSEFIGFWRAPGRREEPDYYFVQRGGKVSRIEALRRGTRMVRGGQWSLEGEALTIRWEDGSSSRIQNTPRGFEIVKYGPNSVRSDSPDSISSIEQVDPTVGRRQFVISATPLAKSEEYVGYWKVEDENTYFVHVDRWSHAKRIRFDEELRLRRLRGRWTMLADGVHITWSNDNQTTIRQTPQGTVLAIFPPEASVATSPTTSETPVERIKERDYEDYLGEMRGKARARQAAEQAEQAMKDGEEAAEEGRPNTRKPKRKKRPASDK